MTNVGLLDEELVQEAVGIVERAQRIGVPLRVMGACAIRIHCGNHIELHKVKMQRKLTDLDFVTLRIYQTSVREVLKEFGYSPELAMVGMGRDIYRKSERGIGVDVFFDKLEMCHTIELEDRLENDFPTLSLADLILEKLQVVKINEKDIKDIIVLLLEHELGETDKETIDIGYIAKLLSDDWGFYYTVTTNLNKIGNMIMNRYGNLLTLQEIQTVQSKIRAMLSRLEEEPKSMKWKIRGKIGTKKIWYRDVEEVAMGKVTEYLMKKYGKEAD
jgi:hypothetical protein